MQVMYSNEVSTSSATQHIFSHTETHKKFRVVEGGCFHLFHLHTNLTGGKMGKIGCFNLMCFVICGPFDICLGVLVINVLGYTRFCIVCTMLWYCLVYVNLIIRFVCTSEKNTATG